MDQTGVSCLDVGSLCHFMIQMWGAVSCYKTLQCSVDHKMPSHMMTRWWVTGTKWLIDSYLPATATPARSKARTERNFLLVWLSFVPSALSLVQTSSSKDWRTLSLTEDLKRGATSLKTRQRLYREIGLLFRFTFQRGVDLYWLGYHYKSKTKCYPVNEKLLLKKC